MGYSLVTKPQAFPVSLDEAKAHLHVDHDDENDLIEIYIAASTGAAEHFTGRAFVDQVWNLYLDSFPRYCHPIEIAKLPLIEVQGVFYRDGTGAEQELDASGYTVDLSGIPARIRRSTWPTPIVDINAVRVLFRSGYVDDSSPAEMAVPDEAKSAILLTIGHLYANREDVVIGQTAVKLPMASEWLLRPLRVHRGMA